VLLNGAAQIEETAAQLIVNSVQESVNKGHQTGGRGIAIVGVVARKRPVIN
jgi:hypothetical protein